MAFDLDQSEIPQRCGSLSRILSATDLDQGDTRSSGQALTMWQTVSFAPFDCDLELAVIDNDGPHALVFPCRRIRGGWINASTGQQLDVSPTHWRPWTEPRTDKR